MRDLVIATIERNFVESGLDEIGRVLAAVLMPQHPIVVTLRDIEYGRTELLVPWLKSLTDEQLLGVLESQHCQLYR